jgi:hypothetical protein
MDTKFVEEYQDKLLEWQKKFFDAWLENMGEGKFPETYEKSVEFQEKMISNYLEAQETASKMVLDTQKKLWNQYFESMRKQVAATPA